MIVVAAAAFVSALDATFMNVSMSQVVADLNTDVATIQKMVTFYTLIGTSTLSEIEYAKATGKHIEYLETLAE